MEQDRAEVKEDRDGKEGRRYGMAWHGPFGI